MAKMLKASPMIKAKPGGKPAVSRKGGLKETSPRVSPDLTGAPAPAMGPGVLSAATAALGPAPVAGAAPALVQAKPGKIQKGKQIMRPKKPRMPSF